jgi:hypothetical protein
MLAIAVGGLLVLGGCLYVWTRIDSMFTARQGQITQLEKEIHDRELIVQRGMRATQKIGDYEQRSLPPDRDVAQSRYQNWLFETAEKQVGFENVVIKASGSATASKVYQRLSYTLSGDGSIAQLTDFLYRFYSVNFLHRIHSLRVQTSKGSSKLRLTFTIEALSLPGAPKREQLTAEPSNRLAATLPEYRQAIVGRNLFAPPNQKPVLPAISSQKAVAGRAFSLSLKATDPDETDRLTFQIEGGAPEGVSLRSGDDGSAQLSWTPRQTGTYNLSVRVTDSGLPTQSDTKTFEIVVAEPPPEVVVAKPEPKPEFDVSKYTYLTTVLEVDGKPQIWLFERTSGTRLELGEGDPFQVGSMKGVVNHIGVRDVVLEVAGKRMVVTVGESLAEAYELPSEEL